MSLRFNRLQSVVKAEVKKDRSQRALRDELFRVLGTPIMVSESPEDVAHAANDRLDVLEATGRFPESANFKHSILLEAASVGSIEVRKLAARLLPERHVHKFLTDPASAVRCAAAQHASFNLLGEVARMYPNDDQLRAIIKGRRLAEAGLPQPETSDEHFDMHGKGRLETAKQHPGDELSKNWYKHLASKLCKDYGANLEGQWEEVAATVHSNAHASFGFKVDRDKLLQAIYDHLEERDDEVLEEVLEEGFFRKVSARLRSSSLNESFMPVIPENVDPITALVESHLSSSQYITNFEKMFRVRKSSLPPGIRKHRLEESQALTTEIPVLANVPGGTFTPTSERALDVYVNHWNSRQRVSGEPFKLSWSPHPADISLVGFSLELK